MEEVKKYYDDGQVCEHYWKNEKGQVESEYKSWYKNGQQEEQGFFKNGLLQGEYKSWLSNGQLAAHCFFKNEEYNGEYKSWNYVGQPWQHRFFHNNNLVDITSYVADVNNITEEEYFLLQITFGYFPVIKFDGKL